MVTMLLVVIFIAYMGLGLPHSVFGAAWPAIQTDFALPIDAANYVTVLISGCTVVSSMIGARLVNKFGTAHVVLASTIVAALSLLGFSISGGLIVLCIFAIPLGLSSGATDAALNNYIALHYKAMHMNFLHCFYGVGVMASPYIMSIILDDKGWRYGYRIIFVIQACIAAVMLVSIPLWKRVNFTENEEKKEENYKNLSYLTMLKTTEIRLDWLMCIAVNAIEGVGGVWGSTYLVYTQGFTGAKAAGAITFFYIGMALGRFLSGLLSTKVSSWKIIFISIAVMVIGVVCLVIPIAPVAVSGLFLLGLGNGPVYPNIMHLTPRHFGEDVSGSVLGSQMATAYLGFTIGPPLFGILADKIGTVLFPYYIGVWILTFIISSLVFLKIVGKKMGKVI